MIKSNNQSLMFLPHDILFQCFSYLDYKDLIRTTLVCKKWNVIQQTEELWHRHVSNYLEKSKPYLGSWKKRFKIIHHWMKLKGSLDIPTGSHCPKNDIYFSEDHDNSLFYLDLEKLHLKRMNFVNNKLILDSEEINFEDYHQLLSKGKIHKFCFENYLLIFQEDGNIFCYDVLTGKRIKSLKGDPLTDSSLVGILFDGNQIVLSYNHKIYVWNFHESCLEKVIDHPELKDFIILSFTSHFFLLVKNNHDRHVYALHRQTLSMMNTQHFYQNGSILTFEDFTAFVSLDGQVNIFQDQADTLSLLKKDTATYDLPHLDITIAHIYHNWLCTNQNGVFTIWNIKTGEKIISFNHRLQILNFYLNSEKLIFKVKNGKIPEYNVCRYMIYDFIQPSNPLNSIVYPAYLKTVNNVSQFFYKCEII